VNNAQAKLSTALNNIAYWHVQQYANAIKANAEGKASAAAVTKAGANAAATANAAARAARLANIEARSKAINATGNTARAAQNAANAAAKAVIARIIDGNFKNSTTGLFSQALLNANANYIPYKSRNNVKQAIRTRIAQQGK
jgi:hypothetical protein